MATKKSAKKAVKKVQRALDSDEAKGINKVLSEDTTSGETTIKFQPLEDNQDKVLPKGVRTPKREGKYTEEQIRERIRRRFFPKVEKEKLTEDQKIAIEHELKIRLK